MRMVRLFATPFIPETAHGEIDRLPQRPMMSKINSLAGLEGKGVVNLFVCVIILWNNRKKNSK